jgi:hypothetical protein
MPGYPHEYANLTSGQIAALIPAAYDDIVTTLTGILRDISFAGAEGSYLLKWRNEKSAAVVEEAASVGRPLDRQKIESQIAAESAAAHHPDEKEIKSVVSKIVDPRVRSSSLLSFGIQNGKLRYLGPFTGFGQKPHAIRHLERLKKIKSDLSLVFQDPLNMMNGHLVELRNDVWRTTSNDYQLYLDFMKLVDRATKAVEKNESVVEVMQSPEAKKMDELLRFVSLLDLKLKQVSPLEQELLRHGDNFVEQCKLLDQLIDCADSSFGAFHFMQLARHVLKDEKLTKLWGGIVEAYTGNVVPIDGNTVVDITRYQHFYYSNGALLMCDVEGNGLRREMEKGIADVIISYIGGRHGHYFIEKGNLFYPHAYERVAYEEGMMNVYGGERKIAFSAKMDEQTAATVVESLAATVGFLAVDRFNAVNPAACSYAEYVKGKLGLETPKGSGYLSFEMDETAARRVLEAFRESGHSLVKVREVTVTIEPNTKAGPSAKAAPAPEQSEAGKPELPADFPFDNERLLFLVAAAARVVAREKMKEEANRVPEEAAEPSPNAPRSTERGGAPSGPAPVA